ncbi:OmpA family protein [Prevotella sp. HUN102]|uniref:OmpA family protein n=1 Tax=Prevotella sp. HUN102 TaxID=1392486 RepID=UPI00048B5BFF|nr:OmpA family protein [Prevotella sp. HUN102]
MKNLKTIAAGMCVLTLVSSCATKQGTFGLAGSGAGAVVGGIIGNIIGKNTKGTMIGAAIGAAVGAGAGTLIGRHMDKVARETAAQVQNAKIEKVTDANGLECVKVTFDNGILFGLNKSDLNASSKKELADFAKVMQKNADCDVAIQGYTDASGNDNINIPLSEKRASAVSSYLLSQGVPARQIRTVEGLGSSNPIENKTVSEKNRRVEVYLYASESMINAANNGTLR